MIVSRDIRIPVSSTSCDKLQICVGSAPIHCIHRAHNSCFFFSFMFDTCHGEPYAGSTQGKFWGTDSAPCYEFPRLSIQVTHDGTYSVITIYGGCQKSVQRISVGFLHSASSWAGPQPERHASSLVPHRVVPFCRTSSTDAARSKECHRPSIARIAPTYR